MEVTLTLVLLNPKNCRRNLVKYYAVWQTCPICFWLNAGDWKLVPCPFMILLKWKYLTILNSEHLLFLVVPYSQKSETEILI